MQRDVNSIGIVETKFFTFAEEGDFTLLCGESIGPVTLAYETYGELNSDCSNAVLILHALSGDAHAAGINFEDDRKPGWWDGYIGPGKPFDTDKYFFICSNVIGGCSGSTGPASINPHSGKEWGMEFPTVTIEDMVKAQYHLVRELGISKLLAVAGGSMGGMQALQWSISFPEMVNSCIAIATAASLSAQGIALNEVGRQAIFNDPNWNEGNYYGSAIPGAGLSLARMIGHITYMSEKHMHERFGREFQHEQMSKHNLSSKFSVESYLQYQGVKFVDRFDANSYVYVTRAVDYFDLKDNEKGKLASAFEGARANFLVISFTTDWLYPTAAAKEIVQSLRVAGKNVIFNEIATENGHDAFLLPNETLSKNIADFLKHEYDRSCGQ